jgi:hypothetical protein
MTPLLTIVGLQRGIFGKMQALCRWLIAEKDGAPGRKPAFLLLALSGC